MRRDQGIQYDPKAQKAIDNLKRIKENTRRGMHKAFNDIGKDLVATSKKMILSKDKTGKVYYDVSYVSTAGKNAGKSRVKKTHRASAPGQAPANLSGRLYKSLGYTIQGGKEISFGNKAPYAAKLEFGGDNVLPRPYLLPSINANKKNIEQHFKSKIIVEITAGAPTE